MTRPQELAAALMVDWRFKIPFGQDGLHIDVNEQLITDQLQETCLSRRQSVFQSLFPDVRL